MSYGSIWKPSPTEFRCKLPLPAEKTVRTPAIWGHRTLPRSSRRLWRIKVCVDQLSGPMAWKLRVLSVCSVSILQKWAKIPAISPGNFSEFATLPRKSEMNFFAGTSQRL